MDSHNEAVAAIAIRVKHFYDRQQTFRIYHGSTNSTRDSQLRRDRLVDTSSLSHVLNVDTARKTALVEPNVPMDRLVAATLCHGLIPPVVMEFPGITVGGGFAGTSGESSSFRYGFFDRTVSSIEMVLANGERVMASSTEKPDLFYGAAASFGTLGVTTLLELQLIEAKSYVELTYQPIQSISDGIRIIEEATEDSTVDYLDGILFSKDSGIICIGRRTNTLKPGINVQRFTRPTDPWFYLHAKKLLSRSSSSSPVTEAIPLVDYLFRYDRGGFWVGAYAFTYFMTPFNRITRWALDALMHTRVMYHALHQSGLSKQYIIQDVAIPYPQAATFLTYLHQSFTHYPLWLCPLHQTSQIQTQSQTHLPSPAHGLLATPTPTPSTSTFPSEMLLNFGIWGPGPKQRPTFISWNRALEQKVRQLGGQKWLYAHAYYTEAEFYEIYPRAEYDALRAKYHASYLPSVFEKVRVGREEDGDESGGRSWGKRLRALVWGIWPVRGLYGVLQAVRGGDYLLPRKEVRAGKGL